MPLALSQRAIAQAPDAAARWSPPPRRPRTTFVRFAMLGPRVSVGWRPEGRRSELIPATIITAVHLAAVLSLRLAMPTITADDSSSTPVTYLDVPPPAAAESPRALVQRARPLVVGQSVKIPAVEAAVVHPDKAAGFQELLAPREVPQVPPPGQFGAAVQERDFSGRGIAGGVAGGKPPVALPDSIAAQLTQQGVAADFLAATQRPRSFVDEDEVLVRPEMTNREVIQQVLNDRYPEVMRRAGIEGSALVEFVVDTSGAVRSGSARVLRSTNQMFADAALGVLMQARFTPGRTERGNRHTIVAVRARLPLSWTLRY